jgi:Sulfotransferase domain
MRGDAPARIDPNRMDDFRRSDTAAELYAPLLSGPVLRVNRQEIAAARPRVQERIARDARGMVLIKTHNARIEDQGFPLINERASLGAIYVIRNPLDVAVSFASFTGSSIDQVIADMATPSFGINAGTDNVYSIMGSWSTQVVSWTHRSDPTTHVVRYEDMLAHSKETFALLAAHVRMHPSEEQLERAISLSTFDKLRASELEGGFHERPRSAPMFFRHGRAGQWQEVMTPAQVARVISLHGEQMWRFGYHSAHDVLVRLADRPPLHDRGQSRRTG